MSDLSTPLLDTLNNKLTDPTLDCKTLTYDPNKGAVSGDTTLSGQQTSPNNVGAKPATVSGQQLNVPVTATKPPTQAPNTPAPTAPLICPDGLTGPRQHEGCTGTCQISCSVM